MNKIEWEKRNNDIKKERNTWITKVVYFKINEYLPNIACSLQVHEDVIPNEVPNGVWPIKRIEFQLIFYLGLDSRWNLLEERENNTIKEEAKGPIYVHIGPITWARYMKIKVAHWVESQLGHGYNQRMIWAYSRKLRRSINNNQNFI